MSDANPTTLNGASSPAASMGKRTTSGFVWLLAQSLLSKVVGLGAQMLWTKFLLPADLGVFTIAYAITLGAGWMQEAGTREVLVRRPKHYARRANSAFWLALLIAASGYTLIWFLGPVLEQFYNKPGLAMLVRIASLSSTFMCIGNVAQAKLEIDMRFPLLARVNLICLIVQSFLTVGLAIAHKGVAALGIPAYNGALSFVIPLGIIPFARTLYLYAATRPPVHWRVDISKWKYLLSGIGLLIVTGACNFVLWQGDNMILGRLVSGTELGWYAFAYNLSQQTLLLLSNNINSVLLPTLSRLNLDPARQLNVYTRSIRALAVVGALLCLLPGILSHPLLALFKPQWAPAAPILMVLSIGMAIRVIDTTSDALLKAQGRFSTLTTLSICQATTFALSGTIAAHLRGAIGMAWAVAACIALFGPLRVYLAVKPLGGKVQSVLGIFGGAFALFALSQVVPLLLAHFLFDGANLPTFLLSTTLGTMIYFSLLRLLAPTLWNDVLSRFRRKRAV